MQGQHPAAGSIWAAAAGAATAPAALTCCARIPAVAHALHVAVARQVLEGVLQEHDVHVCTPGREERKNERAGAHTWAGEEAAGCGFVACPAPQPPAPAQHE